MIRPSHVSSENNGTQTKALNPCVLRRREKEYTMCEHQSCWSLKALVITTERDASNPQSNAHPGGICPWRRDRNPLTPTETESLCNSAPSDKSYSYCIWWILSFPPIRLSCCFRSVCLCMCVRLKQYCVEYQTLKSILILRYMYLSISISSGITLCFPFHISK